MKVFYSSDDMAHWYVFDGGVWYSRGVGSTGQPIERLGYNKPTFEDWHEVIGDTAAIFNARWTPVPEAVR